MPRNTILYTRNRRKPPKRGYRLFTFRCTDDHDWATTQRTNISIRAIAWKPDGEDTIGWIQMTSSMTISNIVKTVYNDGTHYTPERRNMRTADLTSFEVAGEFSWQGKQKPKETWIKPKHLSTKNVPSNPRDLKHPPKMCEHAKHQRQTSLTPSMTLPTPKPFLSKGYITGIRQAYGATFSNHYLQWIYLKGLNFSHIMQRSQKGPKQVRNSTFLGRA